MDISGAISSIAKRFKKPEGYTSAKEEAAAAAKPAAPAPAPAPAPSPQLGGINLDANARREKAAGLKHGGKVSGPGTGTSDSIPAKLSNGEFVFPADTTAAIGVDVLNAIVAATHKPVSGRKSGPISAMANGGCARKGYADGGLAEEEERKRGITYATNYGAAGSTGAQRPPEPGGLNDFSLGSVAPGVRAVLDGASDDTQRAAAAGNYGQAVSQAARGVVAAIPASFADVTRPARAVISTIGSGMRDAAMTFATGSPGGAASDPALPAIGGIPVVPPPASSAVAPRPVARPVASQPGPPVSPPTDVNPQDQRLAAQSAGQDVEGMPQVKRLVDATGKVLYTNVPGTTIQSMRAGPISAQSMRAADALDARGRRETQATRARDQLAREEADAAATNARTMEGIELAKWGPKALNQKRLTAVAEQRNAIEAGRAAVDAGRAVSEASYQGAQAGEARARTRSTISTLAAQEAYSKALASGDAKAIQAAEQNLRALQGKYEKEPPPDLFTTTAIPAGVDPVTGMPRGAGAIVTNRRDGSVRIISADEAKGPGQKSIATDPKAIAIRDNASLSAAQKREQLQALGYK